MSNADDKRIYINEMVDQLLDVEEVVELLKKMISIPSVNYGDSSCSDEAEKEMAEFVAACCRNAGLSVSMQEVFPGRPNVIATLDGKSKDSRLAFCAPDGIIWLLVF